MNRVLVQDGNLYSASDNGVLMVHRTTNLEPIVHARISNGPIYDMAPSWEGICLACDASVARLAKFKDLTGTDWNTQQQRKAKSELGKRAVIPPLRADFPRCVLRRLDRLSVQMEAQHKRTNGAMRTASGCISNDGRYVVVHGPCSLETAKLFPMDLPRSAIIVLESLSRAGPMSPKDISIKANLAPRTTAFAIQRLMNHRLVKRVPNLSDMRQPLYLLNKEELRSMFRESGPSPLMRLVPGISNWKRTA